MYLTKPLTQLTGISNTPKPKLESTATPKTDPKLNSKPLRSITIYLDILNSSLTQQKLAEEIEALGGIVETFLGKNVNYFVTNRRTFSQSNNSSGTLSSFNSMSRSSAMTADSPWTNESLRCNVIKRAVKSRADTLLEKAQKSVPVKYTGDVLQMASHLGIKIIHLSKFNIWLKNLKSKCKLDPTTSSSRKGINKFKIGHSSKTRLVLPFFKYEDYERAFCPQYRQLQEWPKLYLGRDCDTSPFRQSVNKKNLKSLTPINARSPLKQIPSPRKLNTTTDFHKNTCQTELPKKPGYCDICSVRYTNINEHIVDSKHKSVVGEIGLFAKLDAFIATLPTLKQIRDKYSTPENSCKISSTPTSSKSFENVLTPKDSKVQYSLKHVRGSEYGTPKKKLKLDSGVGMLSFTDHNTSAMLLEDKENLKGEANAVRTPEKIPFQRNGFQQTLQNATFCNPDVSLNDLENHVAEGADPSSCVLKITPSRLLRSTSHRRILSSNTSGDLSGNSPPALSPNALSKNVLNVFNHDDADSAACNSLWNQFEPLNLSTKLSLESLMMENEQLESYKEVVASNSVPFFESPAAALSPLPVAVCALDPVRDDLESALENVNQSFVLDEEMKEEEDKSWESAIDSFISNKLKSMESECELAMNSSANASAILT